MNSKILLTLIGLLIVVGVTVTVIKPNHKSDVENFWNISAPRTVKVFREVHSDKKDGCKGGYSLLNNHRAMLGDEKFISRPSFQGLLEPRMTGMVDYGTNIRYNMPSYENQGVPCDPLSMGDMVKENYTGCGSKNCSNNVSKCAKGGHQSQDGVPLMTADSMPSEESNYINAMNKVYDDSPYPNGTDLVAVGDMQTIGADGLASQPIVYDRYIYANQKSNLRALGDPIRGDLPIVPCNNGWFNPSVNPHIDLHEGAINVIAGPDNGTARTLGKLNYITSGRTETINAGIDMSNQYQTTLGAGMGDVHVSAFA